MWFRSRHGLEALSILSGPLCPLRPVGDVVKAGHGAAEAILEATDSAELAVVHHREAQRFLPGDHVADRAVQADAQFFR